MADSLIPARAIFRFAVPCLHAGAGSLAGGLELPERFQLPFFGELEGRAPLAEVRAAWNDEGLVFSVRVFGKRQAPWCRDVRIDDSDGLQVWIDTRDTHNIHRASRFCHRFVFLPSGGGPKLEAPVAEQMLINRARENPKPVKSAQIKARSEKRVDGYVLRAVVAADALTGFDPADHPRLGFTYLVADRELGEQTFTVGGEFPFREDPSLWGTLELAQ
jgi:hypothetical protein